MNLKVRRGTNTSYLGLIQRITAPSGARALSRLVGASCGRDLLHCRVRGIVLRHRSNIVASRACDHPPQVGNRHSQIGKKLIKRWTGDSSPLPVALSCFAPRRMRRPVWMRLRLLNSGLDAADFLRSAWGTACGAPSTHPDAHGGEYFF